MIKKICAVIFGVVICCVAGTVYAIDISPHEEGVCAPNYPIASIVESEKEECEPESVEDILVEENETEEIEEDKSWVEDDEDLTVEEKVRINRDPESDVWWHIKDEDCPGHEWFDDVCLNCGATRFVEEDVYEDEGTNVVVEDSEEVEVGEEDIVEEFIEEQEDEIDE